MRKYEKEWHYNGIIMALLLSLIRSGGLCGWGRSGFPSLRCALAGQGFEAAAIFRRQGRPGLAAPVVVRLEA